MQSYNQEVIFAIVDAGYAEEVMEHAKSCGVSGGTILNARGIARDEAASFFGIVVHAEKEVLMMVVDSSIKDKVMHAIYSEAGISKHARGIVFSLPVSESIGLMPSTPPEAAENT